MTNALSAPQKVVGHQGSVPQRGYSNSGVLFTLHRRTLVVCRIVLGENQGGGTGFLIGKDLIMTNNHVLNSLEVARTAKAHFFYTIGSVGIEVALNPDLFFYTSPTPDLLGFEPIIKDKFDFTIVSIHPHPKITEVSHLAFSIFGTPIPERGSNANIIHHPINLDGTSFQKVSFRENLVKEVARFTIHYTTTTLSGSSGSPVIDDEGNLIALHRATCTHILKALLKEKMLADLLGELFPGVAFINQTLTLMDAQSMQEKKFTGLCGTIEGSPLYVFSEGELKGQYFHQGKITSLFRLIATKHTSAKEWALQFLNSRLQEPLADYHRDCNTAVTIKAVRDHLQAKGLLPDIRLRYEESQKSLRNLLKESYLKKCALLPLVLTNAAFPIESFFTQLSIVSHSSQEKKEEEARKRDLHLVEKDSLRETYARLCTTEKPIEINNLFDSHKRVLVLGRAGIGKSTLCQKIAYEWASGTLFNQKFELVYHIKLRDFNPQKKFSDEWLSRMIAESCYGGAHQEKILQELQNNPEKILLIFDGWDEASPELTQALETYFLHTQAHYLLTSRPGVTSKIQGNFDLIVENMGFNRTQVETYIEKFFTHTQCVGLDLFLKMLRSRSNLLTIAHIPIQLQILCTLWQNGEQEFPQTLTPLFSKITHYLFEWEQNKNPQKESLTSLKQLFLYQALGEVALKGLESKQLIIPKKLIGDALIEKSLEDPRFEKINRQTLIGTGLVKACGANDEIYFLHLTYQEYSIARYISSLRWNCRKEAEGKQRSFVQTYRYKPQFHLVIRMLAGCIWEDSNKNIKALETFFEWLYSGHIDLVGGYHIELVLSCLDECQNVELEKSIWEKYRIRDFVESILEREATREYLGRLMAISRPVFTRVIQHLEKVGAQDKEFLSWFFKNIIQYSNEERTPKILTLLQAVLRDRGSGVCGDAIEALGGLAAHAGKDDIPQILKELQTILKDQNWQVRRDVVKALGVLATHAGKENIPQILKELQAALSDQEGDVRGAAAGALGKLAAYAEKENIPQILNLLQTTLSSQGDYARRAAANALGEFAAHAGKENIPQILNGLQTALSVQGDEYGCRITAGAFRKLATHAGKENFPQILNGLQMALRDPDWQVRRAATYALGALAAHVGKENTPQILKELQTALSDQKEYVRRSANEVFRELVVHLGKENIPQISNALQAALSNQDWQGRTAAADALGELAAYVEKENIPQILKELQATLRDQEWPVRKATVGTLGKLATYAEKENIPQILKELQMALRDPDWSVCRAATKALGELAAHVEQENIPHILKEFQAAFSVLSDTDGCRIASEAFRRLAAHVGKENIPHILKELQTALSYQDWSQGWQGRTAVAYTLGKLTTHVGKEYISQILNGIQTALRDPVTQVGWAAAEAFREVAAHLGKENIPQILNVLQTALSHHDWIVKGDAVKALGKLATHVEKEHIPQILIGLQAALRDRDSSVRRAAFQTTLELKTKWLLSILASQPLSHPTLLPIIFEHFINQSIPLYFVENSHSIHTSDTCYEAFNPKQLRFLFNRCAALFTQTWTESTESENTEETCILM